MKRTILTLASGLLFTVSVMAQGSDRTNAIMAFKDYMSAKGDLNIDKAVKAITEAKDYIDKAYTAAPTDHKTLFYRASIYLEIGQGVTLIDPTDQAKAPSGDMCSGGGTPKFKAGVDPKKAEAEMEANLKIGLQSFKDALANPSKKDDFSDQIKLAMNFGAATVFNCGSKFYNEKKYKEAVEAFQASIALKDVVGLADTLAYYNSALCYERLKDTENEIKMWQKCVDLQYGKAEAYSGLANALNRSGRSDEAAKVVIAGRAKYPKDQGLIISEVNYHLGKGDNASAEKAINEAIAIDNKNATLYFALGSVYDNLANPKTTIQKGMSRADLEKLLGTPKKCEKITQEGKEYDACTYGNRRVIYDGTVSKNISGSTEVDLPAPANRDDLMTKAENSYKKSLEIDGIYFDALYNLGAMKYNEGANKMNKINDIADDAEYAKEKARAEDFFKSALPYIEKARTVNSKDRGNLEMLKNIYTRLGETEKAAEVKAVLDGK